MLEVVFSEKHVLHDRPSHVERANRLTEVMESLKPLDLRLYNSHSVSEEEVTLIHNYDYVREVEVSSRLKIDLDQDTYITPHTFEVALYALGASEIAYKVQGFAIIRPPGHHAGVRGRAMGAPTLGFCVFNNIAYAVRKSGRRTLIVDFDVHHGNGTQEIFYDDPKVVHVDIHQDPRTLFPGTGFPEDLGGKEAEGTKVNLLMPPGSSDDLYLELIPLIQGIMDDFKPEVIAYSAGFDAFAGDGLANLMATERSFYEMGLLSKDKRKFAVLEGGYSSSLKRGPRAFAEGFLGEERDYPALPSSPAVKSRFRELLDREKEILRPYWKI
jgi:acetoin utilization deacetylase AcuC-like enzyme